MFQLSIDMFVIAFAAYFAASILYVIGVTGRKIAFADGWASGNDWTNWGYGAAVIGVLAQLAALVTRWIATGHAPVSDMFEYMSFWGFTIMTSYVIFNAFYRLPILGAFACPVGLVIIAYASVFPTNALPLIPALQSYWLYIHVTTAAAGEGIFTIGFAAAYMYLLRTTDFSVRTKGVRFLEFTFYLFIALLSFVLVSLAFKIAGYSRIDPVTHLDYSLPALVGSPGMPSGSMGELLGISLPLFDIPAWMRGVDAAMKLNTMLWSLLSSLVIYAVLRLLARGRFLVESIAVWVGGLEPQFLDELSYRAIAIGYPVFTLGALVFAMLWAQEAWGSYWSWDPKETWALITMLYYTAYLHLRLTRDWEGKKSAWMAVFGFVLILFLLVGVNLLIVGLHSYAVPPTTPGMQATH
jgi:ABC-type transport system involved in cytochrome c biogenesis permease subunit